MYHSNLLWTLTGYNWWTASKEKLTLSSSVTLFGHTASCHIHHGLWSSLELLRSFSEEEILSLLFFFFVFLGLYPWHVEVPRLGVQLERQVPAYTSVTATQDLSHVCNLHHSSWQRWILIPLSKARDWTCVLMDMSQVHYCWPPWELHIPHFFGSVTLVYPG